VAPERSNVYSTNIYNKLTCICKQWSTETEYTITYKT